MSKKPLVAFYGLWPELHDYTKKKLSGYTVALHSEPLSEHNRETNASVLVLFIDSTVKKNDLAFFPELKCITTMSTGYDHVDLAAARKKGILVCNVPTYGSNTVAEHTFALILGLTRKLFDSVKRVKEGNYDFHGLRGTDLMGKTLGIVGTGNIGAHVAKMSQGFEMQVVAYDLKPNKALAKKLGFTYVTLPQLLKQSDIVTLHAPLLKSTHHLINIKNIVLMKKGALLINTARGALIDPEALLKALTSGKLSGAGLDVLEDENLLQHFEDVMRCGNTACKLKTSLINNLLIDHPNTIVTPHNAFNSTEALQRIIDVTVENIRQASAGTPQNLVV